MNSTAMALLEYLSIHKIESETPSTYIAIIPFSQLERALRKKAPSIHRAIRQLEACGALKVEKIIRKGRVYNKYILSEGR